MIIARTLVCGKPYRCKQGSLYNCLLDSTTYMDAVIKIAIHNAERGEGEGAPFLACYCLFCASMTYQTRGCNV